MCCRDLLGAIRATARCRALLPIRSALACARRSWLFVCGSVLRARARKRAAGVADVLSHRNNGGLGIVVADRAVDLRVLLECTAKTPGRPRGRGDEKTDVPREELAAG